MTSARSATLNQPVTFTVSVTGSVTLLDGNTVLGTTTLNANGTATLTTSGLSLGIQTITAIHGGDANYGDSSGSLTETVKQATAGMTFMSNNIQSQPGQSVTFSATVMSAGSPFTPAMTPSPIVPLRWMRPLRVE